MIVTKQIINVRCSRCLHIDDPYSTSDALTTLSCVYSNASHIFLKLDGACIQLPPRPWN